MIDPNTIVGGRYRVVKPLGGGGMKLVYLAEDLRLASRRCALAEMIDSLTNPDTQRQAAVAFKREAEMLAQLNNEHIPRIFDCFSEQNRHYLVMEYIEGSTLDDELKRSGGRLDEQRVVDIALQVLETLAYLHNLSPPVIYRDLKPSNIMLTSAGQAKLIDFGIARHFQPLINATMIGTQGYAPPEQYRGKVEFRSDLYSLAATMHHCLTGRDPASEPPFSFPPLRKARPEATPALAAVIDEALAYDLERRVPNALEFRRRLAEIKRAYEESANSHVSQSPRNNSSDGQNVKRPVNLLNAANLNHPSQGSAEAATVILGNEIECAGCHRRIPADSRFCSYCAADLRHVLGPSHVALNADAVTMNLPHERNSPPRSGAANSNLQNRGRLRIPFLLIILLFAAAFIGTKLVAYFSQGDSTRPGGPTPPVSASPSGGSAEPAHHSARAMALRKALDHAGFSSVHFKIDGDTILLWGTVPSPEARMMVQTLVFTVGDVFSIEDHIRISKAYAGP